MSRLGVGLLAAYVVLGSACSDSVGPALEGLVMEGRPVEPARESHPYADTLTVSGGQSPYEWDVFPGGTLPPGLSLSAEGVISGIPEMRGTWKFTVRVRSADGKGASETLSLTVWPETAPVLEPTESCSDYPGWAVATFEDPRLEEAIGGPGSCEELAEVLVLEVHTEDTIGSLVGLQNLPALAHLGLYSAGSISDIRPLEDLPHLFNVFLSGHAITDPSPVSGHEELTDLRLNRNQISDLGGLADLPSLERLRLGDNRITDVTPLGDLTSLTILGLENNDISDVSALAALTRLRGLGLSNNGITDVSPLAQLPGLTILQLEGNSLSDIEPLRGLTNLTTLLLAENSLSDLEPLRRLSDLTVLDLGGNSVSDIDPLGGLTDIRSLELNDNRITDLSALVGLTGLAYLDLSGNAELSDIQPLLDNPGLPVHTLYPDGFDLTDTSVPCDDIAALEERGVWVWSDCP